MINIKNFNIYILNFFFYFFPISLVLGNQATNLNVILICLYTLLLYPRKILSIRLSLFDKILIIFFIHIFFSLLINYFEYFFNDNVFPKIIINKSIFYFRYLILYLVLRFLINERILNIKYFYLICALTVAIISIDIIIQFLFGKNIIGLAPPTIKHYSGFFGNELIAGGFILKFYSTLIVLPIIFNFKNFNYLIQIFLFLFFLFVIILSGNRMSLILYLISLVFYMVYLKNFKKYFWKFFFIFVLFLIVLFNSFPKFQYNVSSFYYYGKKLITIFINSDQESPSIESFKLPYVGEFYCGKIIIEKNPLIGGGIRSYRTYDNGCNTHPHNYYLEIVSDLGLIGLTLIIIFIFKLLFESLKILRLNSNNISTTLHMLIPPFLFILIEFFPLRTSGSFFSTSNASIIFIFFAILVSLIVNKSNKV